MKDGDTVQISDNDGNLSAIMTLKETWADYKVGANVESSYSICIWTDHTGGGYVDADCDAVKRTLKIRWYRQ